MPTGYYPRLSEEERFFQYVDWQNPTNEGCWLWIGRSINERGYGNFRTGWDNAARRYTWAGQAHRYAYMWAHGPIPDGLLVCHRCDVRLCCNPEHLFLGTPLMNTQDMQQKGRMVVGSEHPNSILTEADVSEIRRLYRGNARSRPRPGPSMQALADRFGVRREIVGRILHRNMWKHVP